MGTKPHLRPLDAFSGLLVRPKCICGQGSAPLGQLTAPPDPFSWWAAGRGLAALPKNSSPSLLTTCIWEGYSVVNFGRNDSLLFLLIVIGATGGRAPIQSGQQCYKSSYSAMHRIPPFTATMHATIRADFTELEGLEPCHRRSDQFF